MIQEGFDRGFKLGALHSVLTVLKGNFLASSNSSDDTDLDELDTVCEIEKMRESLEHQIPEIKIASNLF